MNKLIRILLLLAVLAIPIIWIAVSWWPSLQFVYTQPNIIQKWLDESPRDHYVDRINISPVAHTPLTQKWLQAYSAALQNPVELDFPYAEKGRFVATDPTAFGYKLFLKQGQRIHITTQYSANAKSNRIQHADKNASMNSGNNSNSQPSQQDQQDQQNHTLDQTSAVAEHHLFQAPMFLEVWQHLEVDTDTNPNSRLSVNHKRLLYQTFQHDEETKPVDEPINQPINQPITKPTNEQNNTTNQQRPLPAAENSATNNASENTAQSHTAQLHTIQSQQSHSNFTPPQTIEYTASNDITLVIVLQAPLLSTVDYRLKLELVSALTFPVSGHDTAAIKSFYGADRDGGRRRHKGVDIFAARHTPLVAVTDGCVTSTRGNKLGGNVVWLRSNASLSKTFLGPTYYYAHLESVTVSRGDCIAAGDVVGTVGNSGNARNTPPHLHFGIYARGGTVDPLPILKEKRWKKTWQDIPNISDHTHISATINRLNIRSGPGTRYDVIGQLSPNAATKPATALPAKILATTAKWVKIRLGEFNTGYVARRYARFIQHEQQPAPTSQRAIVSQSNGYFMDIPMGIL